ncbi:hypothetical protein Aduo_019036 [Ancylostoma duodenale]
MISEGQFQRLLATLTHSTLTTDPAKKFDTLAGRITPQEVKFDDAISTLKDLFGPQQSLFSTRYICLKLTKDPKDDFATYAGRVNRECAKFKSIVHQT